MTVTAAESRAEVVRELLRRKELADVLGALRQHGIHPILFKGTPLAYLVYEAPTQRTRSDTDLLIRREDTDAIREILGRLGYTPAVSCDGELLFCQFEMQKEDAYGVVHALDFHWKVSMQTLFSDLLTYEEMSESAVPVPSLSPDARAAGPVHALLLACVHPAMHHQNAELPEWVEDVHLIASRLSAGEWTAFASLALDKRVAAICVHQLRQANMRLGTVVPGAALSRLAVITGEPTAAYLDPGRRWHDELASNVRNLGSWRDRMRLLREVTFPSTGYMLRSYAWPDTAMSRMLLPALYAHRGVRGVLRVMLGRK